ncbi:mannose/fructose/sorbose family PTS transporter subunit IIC [Catenisphaera adipataccumulans]|jgi:PTS system mannose-specific IIC component|uniref:PTS system mannose-specific IIC component n=1 Tax=Catenisphaera adipataccumulans TaxID=700500 RepID=A0A7W8CVY4_9FIRM|nr:mannose/fructose/sorbose family PTS transporter subunit IIC [Catenisphaera adipataccumulans]MBB5182580.1 PTS system mannose-specific IIC component [Catenisphaera adipataccumulans]
MSVLTIVLIVLFALLAGIEGVLDEFQFHQPLVACTLIGLATGYLREGILLGGSLQMIALGWANIGAAVGPDAALAGVLGAVILSKGLAGGAPAEASFYTAIALAIPLSVIGVYETSYCRNKAIGIVKNMDAAAERADFKRIEQLQRRAILMQGMRVAIPALILCLIPASGFAALIHALPQWLTEGIAVSVGFLAAVGFALLINTMASKETWPFFVLGFVLAGLDFTLIGLSIIGLALALLFVSLKKTDEHGESLDSILK